MIRNIYSLCSSEASEINEENLVVLLINTTKYFSGSGTRTEVFGNVIPEQGLSGVISFITQRAFIYTKIELQT